MCIFLKSEGLCRAAINNTYDFSSLIATNSSSTPIMHLLRCDFGLEDRCYCIYDYDSSILFVTLSLKKVVCCMVFSQVIYGHFMVITQNYLIRSAF